MKRSVRELIQKLGKRSLPKVEESQFVFEALDELERHDVGLMLVMREGKLVGVFSERDFARLYVRSRSRLRERLVGEVAQRRVYYVTPDYTLEECLALMSELHIRHLPVLEGDRPVGIVSMRDIVQILMADREFLIDELVKYISGSPMAAVQTPRLKLASVVPRVLVGGN